MRVVAQMLAVKAHTVLKGAQDFVWRRKPPCNNAISNKTPTG
jgi:hypothetical protein